MEIHYYTTMAGKTRVYIYPNRYQKKYPNGRDGLSPYSRVNQGKCLARDNYTCQICGATGNPDVHHKDNGGRHIKGSATDNSLSNLITLCKSCHHKLHHNVIGKNEAIMVLREKGETLQQIANRYGVSRQRIHQLIRKITPRVLDRQ